jgi:hypothetical protein
MTAVGAPPNLSLKRMALQRWGSFKNDRSSWDPHWRDVSDYLFPGGGRFFLEDRNKGTDRQVLILNSIGTLSLETLGAGMMSGASSPARPWFKLGVPPDLEDDHEAELWLDIATKVVHRIFRKANTYRVKPQLYQETAAFGTGCCVLLPHRQDVIHYYPVTCGEYGLAQNAEGVVDCIYREFQMTVGQMVKRFGKAACSAAVQQLYNAGNLEAGVPVLHLIEPREDRDPFRADNLNMPFRSVYLEPGNNADAVLSESGFRRFPALATRWSVLGNDVYGRGPGRTALPEIKGLQNKELTYARGADYKAQPPMQGPASVKEFEVNLLPGGFTPSEAVGGGGRSIEPIFEAQYLDLNALQGSIEKQERQIERIFFVDLFRMFSYADKDMTAAESYIRQEEKFVLLGPVWERLQSDMLAPEVEIAFNAALEGGLLPPMPQQLLDKDVQIEFVSLMAQAQKQIANNASERWLGSVLHVALQVPDVLDNFDQDVWARNSATNLGVEAQLIRSPQDRDARRSQRYKAMAAKDQADMMVQQARAAKDFAAAPTGGTQPTALTDLTGYSVPPVPGSP